MEITTKNNLTDTTQTTLDWKLNDILTGQWNKIYKIDKNAPFYFRLMDNSYLTNDIRRSIKNDQTIYQSYQDQLAFLERQKKVNVWLKVNDSIISMTLLDVYNTFLCYLKDKSYEDQLFNVNDVSFIGPLGPFTPIPLVQCINERIVNQFIYASILNNKIPMRKMRILTEGQVKVTHGNDMNLQSFLEVKQITDTGILFSCKDEFAIEDMSRSEVLKFHVNTEKIKSFTDNNFQSTTELSNMYYSDDDLRYFFIEEKKIQKNLSFRSDETNEFFLFCRYHDMLESDVPGIFSEFVTKLEDYFKYLNAA